MCSTPINAMLSEVQEISVKYARNGSALFSGWFVDLVNLSV